VAEVSFELAGLLTVEGDEAEWRFPLVVAPKYIPGAALEVQPAGLGSAWDTDQVPDASRLNPPILLPGYPDPVRLGIAVDWDPAGLSVDGFGSSLHAVTESRVAGTTRIRLAQPERVDRDFILRCRLRPDQLQASAVLVRDEPGPAGSADGAAGTVMVTLVPPPEVSRRGRDVVFLLDRSGSMDGWKIAAARRAVARMVDTLGPDDRLEVATFSTRPDFLGGDRGGLRPASDRNRFRAVEFLSQASAGGGTAMAPAIQRAMALLQPTPPARDAIVFLVTDGQVGNEDGLLRGVGTDAGACRFQILGIDEAVNDGLLKRLADSTGGWFLAAESEDRLDAVLVDASRKYGGPVVTDIRLQAPGLDWLDDALVSSGSLDLYPGTPLVLLGRCRLAPESLAVTGGGGPEGFSRTLALNIVQEPALRKVWARWRVRDLEDRLVRAPRAAELRQQLVELSRAQGVLCRFTAFLAVDDASANPGGRLETILQPVETPRGWTPALASRAMEKRRSRVDWLPSGEESSVALPCPEPCVAEVMDMPAPAFMRMDAPAPAGSAGGNREPETLCAAAGLLEFLEGLGPVADRTAGTLDFPEAFFELLRQLKGGAFRGVPVAGYLLRLLEKARSRHLHPFKGRQARIQAVVSELTLVLRDFLQACGALPEGQAGPGEGARPFWEP